MINNLDLNKKIDIVHVAVSWYKEHNYWDSSEEFFLAWAFAYIGKIGISPDIHNINFCSHFSFVVVNLVILRPFSSDLSPG